MLLFVRALWLSILLTSALMLGCKDKAKVSEEAAKIDVGAMVTLANEDVAEVERGLPEGGRKMATELGKEPGKEMDPQRVRSLLRKIREIVPDLAIAKSTFFVLSDDQGIAVRNDLEQDTMAGKDLVAAYPALKKVLAGDEYVATNGQFPGASTDKEWVAGTPVKKKDGALVGMLVTGWSYRRFAYHLQDSLKRILQDRITREGDIGKLPIFYVFVFDKEGVYGARGTPVVNEKTLADMNLVGKTAQGLAHGTVTITDRAFGWAAERVPKLGDDVGVVILRSEI